MRHSRRNQVKYLVGGVGELGPSLKGRGVIRERQQSAYKSGVSVTSFVPTKAVG